MSEIDLDGFDDVNKSNSTAGAGRISDQEEVTGIMKDMKKSVVIITSLVVALVLIYGIYWAYSNRGATGSEYSVNDGVLYDPVKLQSETTLKQDENGITVNGYHDNIATVLLQGYPTRVELQNELARVKGAEVSKEEFNNFLLNVSNNAEEIRKLKEESAPNLDSTAIRRSIQELRSTAAALKNSAKLQSEQLAKLESTVGNFNKELIKLKKDSGWHHNRISNLEGNPVKKKNSIKIQESKALSPARRVEMKAKSAWSVNGASKNLAFIQNSNSGKRLRVTRGFDIPGCGQVTDISPSDQKVTTTTCVISRIDRKQYLSMLSLEMPAF